MGQKESKPCPENLAALAKDTQFSEDEVKEWYHGFCKDCPRGSITGQEFKQIYREIYPQGDPTKMAEHIFRLYDVNRDGRIDFREFLCGLSVTSRGSVDERLRLAFSLYDLDGDGYILRHEMTEIINSVYRMAGDLLPSNSDAKGHTETVFKQLDKNKDNRLSLEEFIEGAKHDATLIRLVKLMET